MYEFQTDLPLHLFHHGENFKTYETMGAHSVKVDGKRGYMFRVWAPHAKSVSVVGDFNGWCDGTHIMRRLVDNETFEIFIPFLKRFDAYKYCIETYDGRKLYKADPYAFHSETPSTVSSNASKLYDVDGYKWGGRRIYQSALA